MHRTVGVLMAVTLLACAQPDHVVADTGQEPRPAAADGHQHDLVVDWIPFSEAEIHRHALAIVRGRVLEQRSGTHRTYATRPEDGYAELPLTTSTLEVEASLRSRSGASGGETGATIQVVQLGGRYPDGCWVEPTDQRLLRVGDEVVVFLKPAGMVPIGMDSPAEARAIIGGQQGMVPIREGVVDPIPATVFARYAGRPVRELEADVEQLAVSSWEEP